MAAFLGLFKLSAGVLDSRGGNDRNLSLRALMPAEAGIQDFLGVLVVQKFFLRALGVLGGSRSFVP